MFTGIYTKFIDSHSEVEAPYEWLQQLFIKLIFSHRFSMIIIIGGKKVSIIIF
jgi:hypothetical protein